jgi:hypothetical protein
MPKSLLILILAAVIGLSVLTWFQFFEPPPDAAPDKGGGVNPGGPKDPFRNGPAVPDVPPVIPRDVPLSVRALEYLTRMKLAMLGEGPPVDAAAMAWLRDTEEGLAELRKLLRNSKDEDIKVAALLTIGQSKLDGTFDTVKEAALGGYGERFQTAGIVAMMAGRDEGIPVLGEVFLETRDEGVAAAALQVLSHLDYDRALAAFGDLMGRVQDPGRRDTLYQILGGHRFAVETDEPPTMVEFRSGLVGLHPPPPDANPDQMQIIDNIVEHAMREEDPKLQIGAEIVLARMPGKKAEEAFIQKFEAADQDHRHGMMGLIEPQLSRGKIDAFLRMAPEMEDRKLRDILSFQASQWGDPRIVDELRIWRDREDDELIRKRLEETISRFETR